MYRIDYTEKAKEHLSKLRHSEPAAFQKVLRLIAELMEHPTTGTGHPHQLSADKAGLWSRSITKKHRLVYEIRETQVIVLVLAAYGHYDDK